MPRRRGGPVPAARWPATNAARPRAWFYAPRQIAPALLAQALSKLESHRDIAASWAVVALPGPAGSPDPAYAIRPDISLDRHSTLASLQRDARVLGDKLEGAVRQSARAHLAKVA